MSVENWNPGKLVLPLVVGVALAGVALGAFSVAHAQNVSPESVVGCYDLRLGPWKPHPPEDSLPYAPPPRVQLVTAPAVATFGPGYLTLSPAPNSLPSVHEFAGWRPGGGDSLDLYWSTGFQGLEMTVRVVGDTLRGSARTFTDFGKTYTTKVIAARVSCASPVPETEASERAILREVSLEGGAKVVLGEALDTSLIASRESNPTTYILNRAPTGLLAGAGELRVLPNIDGVVRGIMLSYPAPVDYQAMAAGLAEMLGPPMVNDSTVRQDGSYGMVGWNNRTTSLYVTFSTMPNAEWRVTVLLEDPRLGPR
jgi:hypothetical protein